MFKHRCVLVNYATRITSCTSSQFLHSINSWYIFTVLSSPQLWKSSRCVHAFLSIVIEEYESSNLLIFCLMFEGKDLRTITFGFLPHTKQVNSNFETRFCSRVYDSFKQDSQVSIFCQYKLPNVCQELIRRSDNLGIIRGGRYVRRWHIELDLRDYMICTPFQMLPLQVVIHANDCVRNMSALCRGVIKPLKIRWNNLNVAVLGDFAKRMQIITCVQHIHRLLWCQHLSGTSVRYFCWKLLYF